MDINDIEARKQVFRKDLSELPANTIVRKHVIFGNCFLLNNDQLYELKQQVADQFKIHPSSVVVVGSAMQGFSIKPDRRFGNFGDRSDVDLALVSSEFFDRVWQDVFNYEQTGGYWTSGLGFKKYLFKGWVRPDKLPVVPSFPFTSEWFEFFRQVSQSKKYGDYPIKAGLYKSWYFLESYQIQNVLACTTAPQEN